jgi:hypothetical protein
MEKIRKTERLALEGIRLSLVKCQANLSLQLHQSSSILPRPRAVLLKDGVDQLELLEGEWLVI